jgi:hypothetical protein
MGGFGSGRHGGRPTTNMSFKIDIARMIRTGQATPGKWLSGSLHWTCGGEPAGSIGYQAQMVDLDNAWLELNYTRGTGDCRETVRQRVALKYTQPHYGGRRWWMICPYRHSRAGMLYMPNGGDRFASRKAWRLGYNVQRVAHGQRPFDTLFRLQRKLGCEQGWEAGLRRPKGMWHRTFERHFDRYIALEGECDMMMLGLLERMGVKVGRA